jgi:hypothetical protein
LSKKQAVAGLQCKEERKEIHLAWFASLRFSFAFFAAWRET